MICIICIVCVLSVMPTIGNTDTNQLEKRVMQLESTVKYLSNHLDKEQLKASNVSYQVGNKDFGEVR